MPAMPACRLAALALLFLMLNCPAASAAGREEPAPQFARHIVAILDRLGCNSGSCHGSFRGQNGFRLSLFGSEPALDYEFIARDALGRRLNLADPDQSLLLLKPSLGLAHRGGLRLPRGGPEYQVLRAWIAAGARFDPQEPSVRRIQVAPAEMILAPGSGRPLRVTATYADGSTLDVTSLSRFETLNDEVALIDRAGTATAAAPGDTPILVRYAGQVEAVQVLVPRAGRASGPPGSGNEYSSAGFIDDEINNKLRKLNVLPSPLCSDVEFLRRVSLDLTGTLPLPAEIRAFVADARPYKRERKIDELLNRPEYAAFWATKFSDWTGNDTRYLANPYRPKQSKQWHDWFRDKLARNVSYSEIATGVLTATSTEGRSLEEWKTWATAEDARLRGTGWDFEYGKRRPSISFTSRPATSTRTTWPCNSPTPSWA